MSPVALHHVVDGPQDAPVVVLLSSLGTTGAMWEPQVAELARELRVVRADHRGHGGSPVPPGPYALADLGRDVLALLDRLGIERAHVAGVSLGGMVGMWLGAHAAERVERLALCCTSARLGPPSLWRERAAAVLAGGMEAVADAVVARWVTPEGAVRDPGLVAWLRAMLVATPPVGYAGCCEAIAAMDLVPALSQVRAPTLVVAAAQDPATPPEHGARIASAVPGARLVVLDGAAHLAGVERPREVARLLREHLVAA
jgi:3-oxoadipate enol-lactonase